MHEVFFYPENFHAGLSGRHLSTWRGTGLIAALVDRIRHAVSR